MIRNLTRTGKRDENRKQITLVVLWIIALLSIPSILFAASSASDSKSEKYRSYNIKPPTGSYDGEHVPQPIEFPHDVHVKVNKINCMYCHTYARRSSVAGIPPTSKCMGCHTIIATDKERIKKLTEYWTKGESPKWKKVHDVPDFVHFSHQKHIQNFVFDKGYPVEDVKEICAFCHGDVENMTVARKVKPLTMGFCQRCHKKNEGPFSCWKCHK